MLVYRRVQYVFHKCGFSSKPWWVFSESAPIVRTKTDCQKRLQLIPVSLRDACVSKDLLLSQNTQVNPFNSVICKRIPLAIYILGT
jgi:hypothetical protein